MTRTRRVPYPYQRPSKDGVVNASQRVYETLRSRRSIREFSSDSVPREVIERILLTASSAPSGAHRQPWTFVAVSDESVKRQIRIAAEAEEKKSYEHRMPDDWKHAIEPLGTNWQKPFIEIAPWIVVVFEQLRFQDESGQLQKNYYVKESVGIACGFLIAAVHQMGLVTLTHTPSPMGFLSQVLGRPDNERPFMLFPIGYPAEGVDVPDLQRKTLDQFSVFIEPSPKQ